MMEMVVLWLVVATACAVVARGRGRDPWGWFAIGFLTSFIGLVVLLALPVKAPTRVVVKDQWSLPRPRHGEEYVKKCPDCAELVPPEARICRHCRHDFMEAHRPKAVA